MVTKIDCNNMDKLPSRIDLDRNLISIKTNKITITTKKGTEMYIKVTIVKAIIFSISSEGIYLPPTSMSYLRACSLSSYNKRIYPLRAVDNTSHKS